MYTLAYLVFMAYIFFVFVRPQDFMPMFLGTPLMLISLMLASACWVISNPKYKDFQPPQYSLMIAIVFMVFLSCFTYDGVMGAFNKMFNFFIVVWAMILCGNIVTNAKRIYGFITLIIFSTSIMAYHAIGQAETGVGFTGVQLVSGRATYVGIFEDPNDLGLMLVASIPLIMLGIVNKGNIITKLILLGLAALHLYAIYLTNSRGTMVGLLGVIVAFAIFRFGILKGGILGTLFLPAILIFAPSRFAEIDPDESSAHGRVDAWYEGLDMFESSPLWGIGYGNYTEYHAQTAHNSYVLVLAEMGFIGFFIWLSFVLLSALTVYRLWKSTDEQFGLPVTSELNFLSTKQVRSIAFALGFSLLGILITCFFLSRSYILPIYIYFGLVIGLYTGVRKQWPDFQPIRFQDWFGKLFNIALISVLSLYVLVKFLL